MHNDVSLRCVTRRRQHRNYVCIDFSDEKMRMKKNEKWDKSLAMFVFGVTP